jgi:hypothetical protein
MTGETEDTLFIDDYKFYTQGHRHIGAMTAQGVKLERGGLKFLFNIMMI